MSEYFALAFKATVFAVWIAAAAAVYMLFRNTRCAHPRLVWIQNIYGDLINYSGGKRSIWECPDCEQTVWLDVLDPELFHRHPAQPGWAVLQHGLPSGALLGPAAVKVEAPPAPEPVEFPCSGCRLTNKRTSLAGNGVDYYTEVQYTCTGGRASCVMPGETFEILHEAHPADVLVYRSANGQTFFQQMRLYLPSDLDTQTHGVE